MAYKFSAKNNFPNLPHAYIVIDILGVISQNIWHVQELKPWR